MALEEHRRSLEIGSHGERLRAVRELGELDTREAIDLLALAVEDVDAEIRDTARRFIEASVWQPSGQLPEEPEPEDAKEGETLF